LQAQLEGLKARGLGVAAISYDPVATVSAFSKQRGITFPLLADVGSVTIKRYGILNTAADQAFGPDKDDPVVKADILKFVSVVGVAPMMRGIALPGTFFLDRQGRVTSRFFEDFYIERNTVSSLMVKLGAGATPVTATKFSSAHLDLTAWPSDSSIAPGNRITIALEVTPHPGIHVYAPGAAGYKPVVFNIAPQPNLRVLPVHYPPPQIYFFKPLKERVPVFQKPFKLSEDLVLEGNQQAQAALRGKESVTITGTVDYQACDNKQCFNPASVPLSWTLPLRPLVFERPVTKK
jgi:peroxiredoxin